MTSDEQPTQPLTEDEEVLIREWHNKTREPKLGRVLAEVDRLRAENHAVTEENSALLRKLEEQYRRRAQSANEITRIRNESTGTALSHLAKIERLQSERDALVRKLGLDWGPDEFGDLNTVPTAVNTDKGGIVVNMEPPHGGSSIDNYAIGFSAGLRRGRRGY